MAGPEEQRAAALRAHLAGGRKTNGSGRGSGALRPILTSLNGDNSWLISFPRPEAERAATGRAYFHLVQDPWLAGAATTFHRWLVWIELECEAAAADGAAVDRLVQQIEREARGGGGGDGVADDDGDGAAGAGASVDAIAICGDLSDHLSKETLLSFSPSIPLLANAPAKATIEAWGHFDTVREMKTCELVEAGSAGAGGGQDGGEASLAWRAAHPGEASLPPWLSMMHVPEPGKTGLNFGVLTVWSHHDEEEEGDEPVHEAIFACPHGFDTGAPSFEPLVRAPGLRMLLMLHPLKDNYAFGHFVTWGVGNGLAIERRARPRYWVNTHNSALAYTGFVMWFVRDDFRTLEDGLRQEAEARRAEGKAPLGRPNFFNVANGECMVLE